MTLRGGRAVQHDYLPGSLHGGCRDKGFAEEDADIGDEVARGGVVGAIEYEVVLGNEVGGVEGCDVDGVSDVSG